MLECDLSNSLQVSKVPQRPESWLRTVTKQSGNFMKRLGEIMNVVEDSIGEVIGTWRDC